MLIHVRLASSLVQAPEVLWFDDGIAAYNCIIEA